jgi:bacillithiol system protein YtxJ
MNWNPLESIATIDKIKQLSFSKPQVIFKHSTRCSISVMAKNRLEKNVSPDGIDFYLLDLLNHRDISSTIAEMFDVFHESPQVLLLKNGTCIYDESHTGISMDEIVMQIT